MDDERRRLRLMDDPRLGDSIVLWEGEALVRCTVLDLWPAGEAGLDVDHVNCERRPLNASEQRLCGFLRWTFTPDIGRWAQMVRRALSTREG